MKFKIFAILFALVVILSSAMGHTQTQVAYGINVQASGVKADGVTNATPALQALINANLTGAFYFAPGTYVLNNNGVNTPGLLLQGFSGTIIMAKGASFACNTATTNAGQCIFVINSSGASFQNLTITYTNVGKLPMARTSAVSNALLVENSANISFFNTTIIGSTGSGIWNTNSTSIAYNGTTSITGTTADGIHFENVGAGSVAALVTNGTGDDAIGDTNIATTNPNCGLTVSSAQITNSYSRGIAVAGGCNAVFSNVVINGTANSALAASQDQSVSSRVPTNVKFQNVVASGVGTVKSTVGGNGYCIDIGEATYVTAFNVTCANSRQDGVFVYGGANNVVVQDVVLQTSSNNGFQSAGATNVSFIDDESIAAVNNGFDIEQSTNVTLNTCQTQNAGGYGFYHSSSSNVVESSLTALNAAGTGGNHRAWWAESMTGPITASAVSVVDNRSAASGYVVGDYNLGGNAVVLNGLLFTIAHGTGTVSKNDSSATYYTYGQLGQEW